VRVRVVGVVCAVAVMLSGCAGSGGEEKPPLTTATSSAVESNAVVTDELTESVPGYVPLDKAEVGDVVEVEVPVKPEPSAAMAVNDEAGARAAVRYFYDVINYSGRAPDPDLIIDVGSDRCEYCEDLGKAIAEFGPNIRSAGDAQVLRSIDAAKQLRDSSWIVSTTSDYPSVLLVDGDGKVTQKQNGPGVLEDQLIIEFDNGEWRLVILGERGA